MADTLSLAYRPSIGVARVFSEGVLFFPQIVDDLSSRRPPYTRWKCWPLPPCNSARSKKNSSKIDFFIRLGGCTYNFRHFVSVWGRTCTHYTSPAENDLYCFFGLT